MSLSTSSITSKVLAISHDLDAVSVLLARESLDVEEIIEKIPSLKSNHSSLLEMQKQVVAESSEEFKSSSEDLRNTLEKCEKLYDKCCAIEQQQKAFSLIPREVWMQIFSQTHLSSIRNISNACKRWNAIVNDNFFWKFCLQRDFPEWDVQDKAPFKLQYANALADDNLSQGKCKPVAFPLKFDDVAFGCNQRFLCANEKTLATIVWDDNQKTVLRVMDWTRTPQDLHTKIDIPIETFKRIKVQLGKERFFVGAATHKGLRLDIYDKAGKKPVRVQQLQLPGELVSYRVTDEAIFRMYENQVRIHKKGQQTGKFAKEHEVLVASTDSTLSSRAVIFEKDLCIVLFSEKPFGEGGEATLLHVWKKDAAGNFPQKETQIIEAPTEIKYFACHENVLLVALDDNRLYGYAQDLNTGLFLLDSPVLRTENFYTTFSIHRRFLLLGRKDGGIEVFRKEAPGTFLPFPSRWVPENGRSVFCSFNVADNHLFGATYEGFRVLRFGPTEGEVLEEPSLSAKRLEESSKKHSK